MSEQVKIAPKTRALADRILTEIGDQIDSKGNFSAEARKNTFRKIATADGRNVDQMLDDDDYRSDYLAAQVLAGGEASERWMKDNKEVHTVVGTFEIGRNKLEISYERHTRKPNQVMDKETGNFKIDGEKDVYGDATVKYKVHGAKASRGELKQVREYLHGKFQSAFGS